MRAASIWGPKEILLREAHGARAVGFDRRGQGAASRERVQIVLVNAPDV